jgi:hypothetical protein
MIIPLQQRKVTHTQIVHTVMGAPTVTQINPLSNALHYINRYIIKGP